VHIASHQARAPSNRPLVDSWRCRRAPFPWGVPDPSPHAVRLPSHEGARQCAQPWKPRMGTGPQFCCGRIAEPRWRSRSATDTGPQHRWNLAPAPVRCRRRWSGRGFAISSRSERRVPTGDLEHGLRDKRLARNTAHGVRQCSIPRDHRRLPCVRTAIQPPTGSPVGLRRSCFRFSVRRCAHDVGRTQRTRGSLRRCCDRVALRGSVRRPHDSKTRPLERPGRGGPLTVIQPGISLGAERDLSRSVEIGAVLTGGPFTLKRFRSFTEWL
jgi:hypothetical protein